MSEIHLSSTSLDRLLPCTRLNQFTPLHCHYEVLCSQPTKLEKYHRYFNVGNVLSFE